MGSTTDCQLSAQEENKALSHDGMACVKKASGKTPIQKLKSVKHLVPIQPDVSEKFWESNEEIIPRNYKYLKFIKHRNKKTVIQ